MNKICTKCKEEKDISEFFKYSRNKDGKRNTCKKCTNVVNEEQRLIRNEKARIAHANLSDEQRKNVRLVYKLGYYRRRGRIANLTDEEWRILNNKKNVNLFSFVSKEEFEKYSAKQRERNATYWNRVKDVKNKLYRQDYKNKKDLGLIKPKTEEQKIARKIRDSKRRKNDPIYRMKHNIRSRIRAVCKNRFSGKTERTEEILGISIPLFKKHIEQQFKEGMSWDNYGVKTWHIDHIIPISLAKTKEQVIMLNHYTNLQPLWARENISKGKKILFPTQMKLSI